MKNSSMNLLLIVFALMLCSATWLLGQTAQSEYQQPNNSPIHFGKVAHQCTANRDQGNQGDNGTLIPIHSPQ